MNLQDWEHRYRDARSIGPPSALVVEWAGPLPSGRALDLASGTGRNAVYLAQLGWQVTAVDGAPSALAALQARSPEIITVLADLESGEYTLAPNSWDLVLTCYYLQRDLFPQIRAALRPGGLAIAIVHTVEGAEAPTYKRAALCELATCFPDCEILHSYEGPSRDPDHKRAVAEIIARRPA